MQSLSYKVCSVILSKFNTFGLFISILGTSAIMDQTACCHRLTTSETGLYFSYKVCSIILPKFNTFGLFISILDTSVIMDLTACCHRVTTSETGLYFSHMVCSIILPKFNTFRLFIPILGTFAIMDQTACCYNVTTSETGLCSVTRCALSYYQNSIHLDCLFQFWVLPLLWTRQLVVIMWPHQKQVYTSVTRCAL